jgi:hypothetical protein
MGTSHLLALAVACIVLPATAPCAAEPDTDNDACNNRQYSVLRAPSRDCTDLPTVDHKQHGAPHAAPHDEPLEVEWLEGEILGFTVIGLGQIRGGTALLSDLWYAAAVLTPPLLQQHPDYGTQLNYVAITPPFVALGLLNGYLRHDHADNARVFLSNFIGFNLSLAWAHHVWKSQDRFFATAEPTHVPQLDASIFALRDGAGMHVAYRW